MIVNDIGQAVDCHYYNDKKKRIQCDALRIFYNEEKSDDMLCKNCPFFRTTAEHNEAAEKARRRVKRLIDKGVLKWDLR